MLCLIGDGQHSQSAPAAFHDAAGPLELPEEPLTTRITTTATAYLLQQSGATSSPQDDLLLQQSAAARHLNAGQCGHHQSQFAFNSSSQVSPQQQQPQELSTGGHLMAVGFCGPSSSDDMLLTGDELGINTREHNFSDLEPLWVRKEWPDILVRISFVAPIVLLGIVGNLTIIWSISRFKSFRSKPTNIFILSMAIADLITALICPLAALFTDIYQFYVLGSVLCRLEGSIKITCLLVSAYSLNWLSFIWLRYIVQPCRDRISIRQSWLILAGIWMASLLMAAPLACWRILRSRQWRDLNEIWCCELIHISKYYWVLITFIIVYVPTFFMTIILVIILIQMDKFEAKLRRSMGNQSSSSLSISMKYRRRIVKVLILYLGISIICWAPFQFSIIYRHFRKEACLPPGYSDFVFASQLLASVPGALNPFVFGFLSEPFRKIVGTFWMFRYLDKLLIWRTKPNSENHQMEVKVAAKQPQAVADTNNHHHHHHHQHQQTTTRVRSTSTSQKRLATTTTANSQRAGGSQSHHHQHRSSSRQVVSNYHRQQSADSVQGHCGSQRPHSAGNTRQAHCNHAGVQAAISGRENAAYEPTLDEERPQRVRQPVPFGQPQEEGREGEEVGTTSFIHDSGSQQMRLQRSISPASVVSMDSINIEENLGTSHNHNHNNPYLSQQQRQPPADR